MKIDILQAQMQSRLARRIYSAAIGLNSIARRLDTHANLSSQSREILLRNNELKGIHKGGPAVIFMTGPSLATHDLSGLGSVTTYAASGFFKHPIVAEWSPNYYLFCDRAYFSPEKSRFSFYDEFNQVISEKTIIFANMHRGIDFYEQFDVLSSRKLHFYLSAGKASRSKSLDFSSVCPTFWGSSAVALALAIWGGASPIYLLGFDHDYLANRFGGLDRHFYEGGTIPGHALSEIPLSDRNPYDWEMLMNYRLWQNYRWLARVAEKNNIEVINCTPTPFLDVFKREGWDTVRKTLVE